MLFLGLIIFAGKNSAFDLLDLATFTYTSVGCIQISVSPPSILIDPSDPADTVGQSLALPVLTISANFALPLSPEAETLLGAAIKVRQKASARASKGRNLMGGKTNAR